MKENSPTTPHIDFLSGPMRYRREHAGLRSELLARAMGARPDEHPYIVDATAGLGRDGFILASLGFEITLLERSETLYLLLKDAILRASAEISDITSRIHLIQADAITWLPSQTIKPAIIYLDPMFPKRKKSASVKKEMVLLQELLGTDTDHALLFQTAMSIATKRVVVKRPRLAPNIVEQAPNYTLTGKSSRFDIYLVT